MANKLFGNELIKLLQNLEELEEERQELVDAMRDAAEELNSCEDEEEQEDLADKLNTATGRLEDWDDFNRANMQDLKELLRLKQEVGADAWDEGLVLINEDYLVRYAQEEAEEQHGAELFNSWPFDYIEWGDAAEALLVDMQSVDYEGETYWFNE